MKKISLLIVCCFCIFGKIASKDAIEDSLLMILPTNTGIEKLKTLHTLQQYFLYQEKDNYYNTLLLEEAAKQENIKYEGIALTNRVAYHCRVFESDSAFYYAQIAEDFCRKNDLIKDLFLVKELMVQRYLNQGHFSLGLRKAEEMNEEAIKINDINARISSLITLAFSYKAFGYVKETYRNSEEALYLDSINPDKEETPYKQLECYIGIAYTYKKERDYEKMLSYTDIIASKIQIIQENYPTYNLFDFEMMYLLYTAEALAHINRAQEAKENLDKADSLLYKKENNSYYRALYNIVNVHYYISIRDWDKSFEAYNIAYEFCMNNHLESEIRELLKLKADMYNDYGDYQESVNAYEKLYQHIDSVNKERFLYEINQLKVYYELDKKEDEITQQRETIQLRTQYIAYLCTLVVLLFCAIFFIWKYIKEIRGKNKLLFSQIKELNKAKTKLLEFKELVQQKASKDAKNKKGQDSLFDKVEHLMETEKPYINSEYGRKNLIADMNTNEVYLAKSIRESSNMTIMEYINSWRLEHAKQFLLNNSNQTIEVIALDSGFNSIRNFYRLFKDTYGMPPMQFRNYVIDENSENGEIVTNPSES